MAVATLHSERSRLLHSTRTPTLPDSLIFFASYLQGIIDAKSQVCNTVHVIFVLLEVLNLPQVSGIRPCPSLDTDWYHAVCRKHCMGWC